MTVFDLPAPDLRSDRNKAPAFADHTLYTQELSHGYEYAEHIAGSGILYMLSGNGDYFVNGQREKLGPSSFLVVSHGSRLSVRLRQAPSQPGLLFFHTGLVSRVMESLGLPAGSDLSFLERVHNGQPALSGKLDWLARHGGSCSSFGALKADCMIRNILEELILQNAAALRVAGRMTVTRKSTRVELYKRLSRTREWILENSAGPLTLEDMSRTAMLNSQHFLRMFRQCYGITPHQFLVETRLGQARQMLSGSAERISVICSQAGFESFSSFCWLFRQRYGITPSGFRNLSR